MKPLLSVLFFAFSLVSCGVAHKAATTTSEDGYILYRQSAPAVELTLLGDYQLHGLKTKYFTDLHKKDLEYFTRPLQGRRPQLMFAAHTTVQPYYSAVGVQYNGVPGDSALLLAAVKEELRQSLRTGFSELPPVTTDYGVVRGIVYQVKNPVTQRHTTHREYFVPHEGYLLRLFFWTSLQDPRILDIEPSFILKRMKFSGSL
ncbi:MAG TPA: hypothetical protein VGE66_16165 [Chitinophagaceae bacterium]